MQKLGLDTKHILIEVFSSVHLCNRKFPKQETAKILSGSFRAHLSSLHMQNSHGFSSLSYFQSPTGVHVFANRIASYPLILKELSKK